LRIAIAHEWLVRYAGSERCVAELVHEFPDARLLTTVVEPSELPARLARAEPSFLQRLPGASRHHEVLIPLMPAAWRLREPVDGVDAVVSSSHACAKAVRVAPGIPHVCYCHTPMRYAWDFGPEARRFPAPLRLVARPAMRWFRRWDRETSRRVTRFIANSTAVAERIRRFYGRDAQVVHPPVRTEYFVPGGERGDEFLFVGRLVSYKRPDLAVRAFVGLPHRLLVVGEGHLDRELRSIAPPNVTLLGSVGDDELRRLYQSCRALIAPGVEDFGIVFAEAQACGAPIVAAAGGGALDIVEDGATGWLVPPDDLRALRQAIARAATESLDTVAISRSAQRFASSRFRRELRDAIEQTVAVASRRRKAA
jgi:glycosyltransferase involved in cell wall biosynthesis